VGVLRLKYHVKKGYNNSSTNQKQENTSSNKPEKTEQLKKTEQNDIESEVKKENKNSEKSKTNHKIIALTIIITGILSTLLFLGITGNKFFHNNQIAKAPYNTSAIETGSAAELIPENKKKDINNNIESGQSSISNKNESHPSSAKQEAGNSLPTYTSQASNSSFSPYISVQEGTSQQTANIANNELPIPDSSSASSKKATSQQAKPQQSLSSYIDNSLARITVSSIQKTSDKQGNLLALIKFEFINKQNNAKSLSQSATITVFQNGQKLHVQTPAAIPNEIKNTVIPIKKNTAKNCGIAYQLINKSPITIQIQSKQQTAQIKFNISNWK